MSIITAIGNLKKETKQEEMNLELKDISSIYYNIETTYNFLLAAKNNLETLFEEINELFEQNKQLKFDSKTEVKKIAEKISKIKAAINAIDDPQTRSMMEQEIVTLGNKAEQINEHVQQKLAIDALFVTIEKMKKSANYDTENKANPSTQPELMVRKTMSWIMDKTAKKTPTVDNE